MKITKNTIEYFFLKDQYLIKKNKKFAKKIYTFLFSVSYLCKMAPFDKMKHGTKTF